MIVLTEQIEIPASYEKLKAWTANFEEEFVKWSPYHIECNLYNGNYNAGSKIFGLTAGLPVNLEGLVGPNGKVWGLESFGFSAPYKVLDEKLGFTAKNVYNQVKELLA